MNIENQLQQYIRQQVQEAIEASLPSLLGQVAQQTATTVMEAHADEILDNVARDLMGKVFDTAHKHAVRASKLRQATEEQREPKKASKAKKKGGGGVGTPRRPRTDVEKLLLVNTEENIMGLPTQEELMHETVERGTHERAEEEAPRRPSKRYKLATGLTEAHDAVLSRLFNIERWESFKTLLGASICKRRDLTAPQLAKILKDLVDEGHVVSGTREAKRGLNPSGSTITWYKHKKFYTKGESIPVNPYMTQLERRLEKN